MSRISAYQKTQTTTASPERILVLLLQTGLRRIREAADAFEKEDYPTGQIGVRKASDIVWELLNTLDASHDPELAKNLSEVYMAVNMRLLRAMTSQDLAALKEAETIFQPICEAFEAAVAEVTGKAA